MAKNKSLAVILLSVSLLATFAVYAPSLNGDFYHDDLQNLVLNKTVQVEELTLDTFRNAIFSSEAGQLRRPISMASFALNYYFFGSSPYSFKLTNLLLHLTIGVLVFFLIYYIKVAVNRTTPNHYQLNSRDNSDIWIPLFVSAMWLLHPLHVSTVAYIVQRMAMLATLFSLLSITFYLVGRIRFIDNKKHGQWYIFASFIFLVTSVFSKENGIITLLFIAFFEFFILRFHSANCSITKFIKFAFYSACLLSITVLAVKFDAIRNYIEGGYLYREFSLQERLLTQPRIILNYIHWLIAPDISQLGLYHDDIRKSTSLLNPASTLFSIILIGLILCIAIAVRKSHPIIFIGVCWFFIGHLIESSAIALELAYEHRNYLPSIGLLLIITELITIISQKTPRPHLAHTLVVIVCILFGFTTQLRANQWSNLVDFSYYEALHHPNSPRAVYALGRTYANLTIAGEKRFKNEAYQYLENASDLDKTGIIPESALLIFANRMDEPANPHWLSSIIKKLETTKLSPSDMTALSNITKCAKEFCLLSTSDANIVLSAAFSSPHSISKSKKRADLLTIKANFLTNRIGNYKEAENIMLEAIKISPNTQQYYINYINLLLFQQRFDDAANYISQLKSIDRLNMKSEIIKKLEEELEFIKSNIISYE